MRVLLFGRRYGSGTRLRDYEGGGVFDSAVLIPVVGCWTRKGSLVIRVGRTGESSTLSSALLL